MLARKHNFFGSSHAAPSETLILVEQWENGEGDEHWEANEYRSASFRGEFDTESLASRYADSMGGDDPYLITEGNNGKWQLWVYSNPVVIKSAQSEREVDKYVRDLGVTPLEYSKNPRVKRGGKHKRKMFIRKSKRNPGMEDTSNLQYGVYEDGQLIAVTAERDQAEAVKVAEVTDAVNNGETVQDAIATFDVAPLSNDTMRGEGIAVIDSLSERNPVMYRARVTTHTAGKEHTQEMAGRELASFLKYAKRRGATVVKVEKFDQDVTAMPGGGVRYGSERMRNGHRNPGPYHTINGVNFTTNSYGKVIWCDDWIALNMWAASGNHGLSQQSGGPSTYGGADVIYEPGVKLRNGRCNPSDAYRQGVVSGKEFVKLWKSRHGRVPTHDELIDRAGNAARQRYGPAGRDKWADFESGVLSVIGSSRRNPEPDAADMYETFHGKPATETLEFVEEHHYHEHLAELGDLTEMKVATVTGLDITVSFDGAGTKLSCNETGTQLYFVGGDQSIDLDAFNMAGPEWEKDHMCLGILYQVTYRTEKGFDEFQLTDYYHDVGEETGVQPVLLYDTLNQTLSVAGGQYQVKDVGIVN